MPTFNINIIAPCWCPIKKADDSLDESLPRIRAHDEIADILESDYGATYATTITFRDHFIQSYPIKGLHNDFKQAIMKYAPKHKIHMYLIPEVANGRLHYHGVTAFKKDVEYETVKKRLNYLQNWLTRKFGKIHMFNRIYSYREEYDEEIKKRKRKTSFRSIYDYIHKEDWHKTLWLIDTLG